ncbi:hypothetical protein D3C81_2133450 [compost metagenome]
MFLMVAVSHNLAHNVRQQGLRGVAEAWRTTRLACGYIHRHARGAGTTGGVTPIAAESATVTPR